jgi:hypothetical protein
VTSIKKLAKSIWVITGIGLILILCSCIITFTKEPNKPNVLADSFATILSAVGGTLVGAGITGIINIDPLDKLNDKLDASNKYYEESLREIKVATLSSVEGEAKLDNLASGQTLYRYFQTLNRLGSMEWRMKEISFSRSSDKKRINAQLKYSRKLYNVQAAYIGKHLLYISTEKNKLDEPMIDIYLDFKTGNSPTNTCSGYSIRYPWDQRNELICTRTILSEEFLLNSAWEKNQDEDYWHLKNHNKTQPEQELEKFWEKHNGNVRFLR